MGISACEDPRDYVHCSQDIEESKENQMFVREYFAPGEIVRINDTLQLHVKCAWLEHHWRLDSKYDPYKLEGYQLLVETEEEDLVGHGLTWQIGVDGFAYCRNASKSSLISDLRELPSEDSILTWKVQKGYSLSDFLENEVIGEVKLKAK